MSDKHKPVPVLYLDLDDTVRHGFAELGRFVNGPKDVIVFAEVPGLLTIYRAHGWRIVAISNQGGIALGHMSDEDCEQAMLETDRQTGGRFDLMHWCIHHPAATDPEYARCWCRKPRIGMIVDAAITMAGRNPGECYPPHMGLFVGDRPEDKECAEAANIDFMDAVEWRTGEHARGLLR